MVNYGTRSSIIDITENLPSTNNVKDTKGIKGHSPLLDYPGFDFVHSIPPEYMHSICLGLVKRLLELTFSVGQNRPRITKRRLSSPKLYNDLMMKQKVPREFSRRARNMEFSVLKAQEMRNITLFLFPIILQCIEDDACLLYTSPSPRDS